MITVIVSGMGRQWRIDTTDPALIGPWLMALFKDVKAPRFTNQWTIEISPGP